MPKIAIITHSTYGHVLALAREIQKSILLLDATFQVDLLQVPETLNAEILAKMHAAPKDESIPVVTALDLPNYDGFLFGFPTRYGNVPAQISSFLDSTGGLWASGALYQKPVGVFVSTGTMGGGQEVTVRNFLSFVVHHGMIFVPLGYGALFPDLTSFEEAHGGSPWGAGTFAGADGSLQPNETELKIAQHQLQAYVLAVNKLNGAGAVAKSEAGEAKKEASGEAGAAEKKTDTAARTAQAKPAAKDAEEGGLCGFKCAIV